MMNTKASATTDLTTKKKVSYLLQQKVVREPMYEKHDVLRCTEAEIVYSPFFVNTLDTEADTMYRTFLRSSTNSLFTGLSREISTRALLLYHFIVG